MEIFYIPKSLGLWVSLALLGLIVQAGTLWPFLELVLFASTIFFLLEMTKPGKSWSSRLLTGSLPYLGVFSVSWATPLFSQLIVLLILFLYLALSAEKNPPQAIRLAHLLFVFLVFLNFFVFRAMLPKTFGLIFLLALFLLFLSAVRWSEAEFPRGAQSRIITFILTVLTAEWLTVLYFLPQGYLSLALTTLLLFVGGEEILLYGIIGKPSRKRLFWEITGGLFVIALLLFSGGIRPR